MGLDSHESSSAVDPGSTRPFFISGKIVRLWVTQIISVSPPKRRSSIILPLSHLTTQQSFRSKTKVPLLKNSSPMQITQFSAFLFRARLIFRKPRKTEGETDANNQSEAQDIYRERHEKDRRKQTNAVHEKFDGRRRMLYEDLFSLYSNYCRTRSACAITG